jgi:hypothetical protein
MTFTENSKKGRLGAGGWGIFLTLEIIGDRNRGVYEEEVGSGCLGKGMQGARGMGGTLFYGAGGGDGHGSVEAVWGVDAV